MECATDALHTQDHKIMVLAVEINARETKFLLKMVIVNNAQLANYQML